MSASSDRCAHFRDHADDLALGGPDGRLRGELLAHAAVCSACQSHLDELTLVTDRLLLLAPSMEPPPGFEGRVLDRLATARGDGPDALSQRQRTRRLRAVAAAAVLLVAVVAGGALGRWTRSSTQTVRAVRSGEIVRADGSVAGRIRLVDKPRPMALVTIDQPRPFSFEVHCSLVGPDWKSVDVGSWSYSDIEHGVWAVGIESSLLDAVHMNVLDANGSILATATLTAT
jgi:hypothetical protein